MSQRKRPKKPEAPTPQSALNVALDYDLVAELRLRCATRRSKGLTPWRLREVVDEAIRVWLETNKE